MNLASTKLRAILALPFLVVDATYVSTQVCSYEPDQTLPPMFSQDQKDALIGLRAELTCSMCKSLFINLVPKFSRLCIWFLLSLLHLF